MKNTDYRTVLRIAGIRFVLKTVHPLLLTKPFEPFLVNSEDEKAGDTAETETIQIIFQPLKSLVFPVQDTVFRNLIFSVVKTSNGYERIYHDHKEQDWQYAIGRMDNDHLEVIEYLEDSKHFFSETSNVFSHIALEELLIQRNAMILHASLIAAPCGGILFSGPSGIGKSTQAALWELYEQTEILNGDRTILRRNEVWKAYGSPYAGSSRYYVNQSIAVRAIVILQKSETCTIKRLNHVQAFRKLYAGMIVNTWNASYVQMLMELLGQLIAEVPVYWLQCTPTKDAVLLLKNTLELEQEGFTGGDPG